MNVREWLETEICSMEFNPKIISKMKKQVKDVCICVLFEDDHAIVVLPGKQNRNKISTMLRSSYRWPDDEEFKNEFKRNS